MSVAILGSINMDVVLHVDDLPKRGETIIGANVVQQPGGKGLNQAVAAVRCGIPVHLTGSVGSDAAGLYLRHFLRDAGVDVDCVVQMAGAMTGHAYICVAANGDNTIVVSPGANAAFPVAGVDGARTAEILLAQLEMPIAAVEAFFRTRSAQTGLKILNAAPAVSAAHHILGLADIIVMNETELESFSGVTLTDAESDIAAAARKILRPRQTVIVTLGAAGAMAIDDAGERVVTGRKAAAVDTVGAGDCFCGVLAAALSKGWAIDHAIDFANAAASISVTRAGAAGSMPLLKEIEAMLA